MTQSSRYLKQILQQITDIHARGGKSLVVFDLDSTLFDVSPRLKKILHNFADVPDNQKRFPEATEILKNAEMLRSDWGIKNALIRSGLDKHHPEFHEAMKEFWYKNFFSNEYLKYDKPFEGAVEYVQDLWAKGTDIAYLTGRDVTRMGEGSRRGLLDWKFPLDDQRAVLVLKPQKGMNDAEFKSNWFLQFQPKENGGPYEKIWFFENEPVNVNFVRLQHQHVELVFFDSTHSGKEQPPSDLPKLVSFLIEEGGE